MRKIIFTLLLTCSAVALQAQEIESATDAVKNMAIGWNLGNTLESVSTDTLDFWTEWSHDDTKYETKWGQPVATRELIHLLKEAGFKTIRVPVTWFPHMGLKTVLAQDSNGNWKKHWYMSQWQPTAVETTWMARVKDVVNYVIDEGLYCILNVHHDTGAYNAAWIHASMERYNKYKDTYETLWTQIANEFKDYDEHLLFEGYNEMVDKYDSWNFASSNSSSKYNASDATDAYKAINSFAQSFVTTVRATGGNNATRNLIVNTYGACCGDGTWNTHIPEPLNNLTIPTDPATGHIAVEVHSYPTLKNGLSSAKTAVNTIMTRLDTYIATNRKVPVIIGEWGTANDGSTGNDYVDRKDNKVAITKYFEQQAKAKGFATVYWMGIIDKEDRTNLKWTQPEVKDAIVTGYYGDQGFVSGIKEIENTVQDKGNAPCYNLAGQMIGLIENGKLEIGKYSGIIITNNRKYILK